MSVYIEYQTIEFRIWE